MDVLSSVDEIDFDFQNSRAKIVVLRDAVEINRPRLKLTDLKQGQEVELPFWVAKELVDTGLAKYRDEDGLSLQSLSKIHWRETLPSSRQVPELPAGFYCGLRRFLRSLRAEVARDPSRMKDYEKAETLSRDIVNCRVRKIISLAGASGVSDEILRNLASEERSLYLRLNGAIERWKTETLTLEEKV